MGIGHDLGLGFSNFALQVQMNIVNGDRGGDIFCADSFTFFLSWRGSKSVIC